MIKIISPNQFKTIAWKNGKGQTTELAISENGTLDNFNWRLSIASVIEDGLFSDFSGFERNLILLEGQGIKLIHDDKQIDLLDKPLSISSFNGASKTVGILIDGQIKDFNLMTKQGKYKVEINTFIEHTDFHIKPKDLSFVYSHNTNMIIKSDSELLEIPCKHLVFLKSDSKVKISGKGLVVINLTNQR